MLLRENGYLYDASYLCEVADAGGPLMFAGDEEWRQYMIARSVLGFYETEEDES